MPAPSFAPPPAEPHFHSAQTIAGGDSGAARTWTWTHPATVHVRWEGPWLEGEWRTEWHSRWIESRTWRVGPFPVRLLDPSRIDIRFEGDQPIFLEEALSGLEIVGPWKVVIKSFESAPERRVLGTWQVHWARVSAP